MPPKDPFDFSQTPNVPESADDQPVSDRDEEWLDMRALMRVLMANGVPPDRIEMLTRTRPSSTIGQVVALNMALMSLADEYGLKRVWLLKEIQKGKHRRLLGGSEVGIMWLKQADGMGGPEAERPLPEVGKRPTPPAGGGLGGPGGAPPPAPKKPLPGAPGASGDAPKGGVEGVKSLLDQGDLEKALEVLKKLVAPASSGKAPGVPPSPDKRAPDLGGGKPPAPKGDGPDAPPAPPARTAEGSVAKTAQCSNCGVLLEIPENF